MSHVKKDIPNNLEDHESSIELVLGYDCLVNVFHVAMKDGDTIQVEPITLRDTIDEISPYIQHLDDELALEAKIIFAHKTTFDKGTAATMAAMILEYGKSVFERINGNGRGSDTYLFCGEYYTLEYADECPEIAEVSRCSVSSDVSSLKPYSLSKEKRLKMVEEMVVLDISYLKDEIANDKAVDGGFTHSVLKGEYWTQYGSLTDRQIFDEYNSRDFEG